MPTSQPLNPPRAARSTHKMKAGESLASVALKHYGDARYAKLITTINRGDIRTRSDNFSTFAFVYPGQEVALPTYEEANVFSRQFFTKQSQSKFDLAHFARPAMPSDSIPVSILPSQGSRSPEAPSISSAPWNETLMTQLPQVNMGTTPSASFSNAPAHANQFECQYIVRSMAITTEEEVIDMSPPTVKVAPATIPASDTDGPQVVTFSHYCRMIKFEVEGGQSDTVIKLQVLEESRWQTITAYIISEQTSRRLAHYADKHNRAVDINLPCEVARELSISDLRRNWKEYAQSYFGSKVANFAQGAEGSLQAAC